MGALLLAPLLLLPCFGFSSLILEPCSFIYFLLLCQHIGQRPSGPRRDNTFLLALVRRELQPRPLSSGLLDKLQKDLKILDPISSGFLLQSQLSRLFLRHEVPLQLPTIKILCQRFSGKGSPEMVWTSCSFKCGLLLFILLVTTRVIELKD